ncbi:MAG: division/cell wall cluster transcriptional repressor MraZ [Gammaproteobacteria bacterium]
MFRGSSTLSVDVKGRIAIPSRYRERLTTICEGFLVLTPNPLDRCLWLYPLPEWEVIEAKLADLSDFDKQSRRAKQMMRGYANDCRMDGQGRILLPQPLRDYAGLVKQTVMLGQGNKFELWEETAWNQQRDQWLKQLGKDSDAPTEALRALSL